MTWPAVTATDVENGWRPLTDSETTVATQRILEVEAELQLRLEERGMSDPPTEEKWVTLYISIVSDIVRRYMQNTEGWVEETEQIDDFRRTKRRAAGTLPGQIYVSSTDVDRLLTQPRRRRGAFTIQMGTT
ncbi:MAG: hypothetical protein DBW62_00650 [Microbacterium sp.]|nr:MAG: hypothetical protein DBW62_00650 [Microbacterium sp.]